jgi:hypothetical protein
MDITFVTSAQDDEQGYFLLKELGMPFRLEGDEDGGHKRRRSGGGKGKKKKR